MGIILFYYNLLYIYNYSYNIYDNENASSAFAKNKLTKWLILSALVILFYPTCLHTSLNFNSLKNYCYPYYYWYKKIESKSFISYYYSKLQLLFIPFVT